MFRRKPANIPEGFFERRLHHPRRPGPDERELSEAIAALRKAKAPFIIAGGGVHYSEAAAALADFAERRGMPVGETQAGKGALPWTHALNMGSIGVTGSAASNELVRKADVILAIGTRLQDFTTGSQALWSPEAKLIQLNVAAFDAGKQNALPLVADAKAGLCRHRQGAGRLARARRLDEARQRRAGILAGGHRQSHRAAQGQ